MKNVAVFALIALLVISALAGGYYLWLHFGLGELKHIGPVAAAIAVGLYLKYLTRTGQSEKK